MTESKFKVGDKVVCIEEAPGLGLHHGQTYTVMQVGYGALLLDMPGPYNHWFADRFAHVRQTEPSASSGQPSAAAKEMARDLWVQADCPEDLATALQKLMDERDQQARDAERTIATLESALASLEDSQEDKPRCQRCDSDRPLAPCTATRNGLHDFDRQPSQQALEMARAHYQTPFLDNFATALQKFMDERDAAESAKNNWHANADMWKQRAEAAEKERDHWADKFLDEQREHTAAVTRAEAAESALAARIEKAPEELDAAFREGMSRAEALDAKAASKHMELQGERMIREQCRARAEAAEKEIEAWKSNVDQLNSVAAMWTRRAEAAETYSRQRDMDLYACQQDAENQRLRAEAVEKQRDNYKYRLQNMTKLYEQMADRRHKAWRYAKRWKALAKRMNRELMWRDREYK